MVHGRNLRKEREEKDKSRKAVHKAFYIMHTIAVLLGVGLIIVAYFSKQSEAATMGKIKLYITFAPSLIYNISGGIIFLSVVCGIVAQICKVPFLWLMFCVLMSISCMAEFTAAGSAVSATNANSVVTQKLKQLMTDYGKTNKKEFIEMTEAWNVLHKKYNCCGVNNYTDWQRVEFGLTSLRVPPSCCLPEKWRVGNLTEPPKHCGQNMLPDHEQAKEFIYVRGCLNEILRKLNLQLFIMGVYGLIVALFTIIVVMVSCFLIITKRV